MAFQGEGSAIHPRAFERDAGYNFAVVVDDHAMQITHVIRGEDHLSNTAAQLLLYRRSASGRPGLPIIALILGSDHTKLSKRHGSFSSANSGAGGSFRGAPQRPGLLGGSVEGGREISRRADRRRLLPETDRKSGAVFDEEKLLWLNGMHIRRLSVPELTDRLLPFLRQAGHDEQVWERSRLEGSSRSFRTTSPRWPTSAAG